VTQAGAAPDNAVLVLNSALNNSAVDGAVTNVVTGLDATIGRSGFEVALSDTTFAQLSALDPEIVSALTGGVSTTALGSVNTGEIVSGTQSRIVGIVGAIVGNESEK
jgi:hypothetical protein